MAFPKKVKIFQAEFVDVGLPTEGLRVFWTYPEGNPPEGNPPGNRLFSVGTDVFLETLTSMTQVPDEHLLASVSMSAILAGGVLPGTVEYLQAIVDQESANFQTIRGAAKIKSVTPVVDPAIGPIGTVFDVEFQRVGANTDTKIVRADTWVLSQYSNRVDNAAISVDCVPGALHKEFAFKKSQLGAEGSANRQAVIDFVAAQYFWV